MKNRLYIFILLSCITLASLQGQERSEQVSEVKVLARAQLDKILLRWSADSPTAWKLLNTYGYTLERLTVTRDRKSLVQPERKTIGQFLPEPLEQWEQIINTNDDAAIMAQAIYGESFQVTGGSRMEAVINLSEELQQRFTFALFSAEQDFQVAVKAGLGYMDKDVRPNEKYLYKVIPNVPEHLKTIKSGGAFVGISDYEALPKPLDLAGSFTDGNALLSWNFRILSSVYNNYNIERSVDGITFSQLNKRPYSVLNESTLDKKGGRIFYVDSVENHVQYVYRVRGITAFGEVGPPSETISGEGKPVLAFVPGIRSKKIIDSNTVELTWQFPEEGNSEIVGFELNRADKQAGPYKVVNGQIPPDSRLLTYTELQPTNYFTITAVGKENNRRTSFAVLVQPIDSIPPAIPTGLNGSIDSLGVVKFLWDPNDEPDFLGYRIFIANDPTHEFTPLNISPQAHSSFVDTVATGNLNEKVYYRVSSVDRRFNMSGLSEILTIEKPDIIPPTAPVFNSGKLTKEGAISLSWVKSSSTDVKSQLLYRKVNDSKQWELVSQSAPGTNSFIDNEIQEGNLYSYTILARDRSSLESSPAKPVSIRVSRLGLRPKVKGFYGQVNKEAKKVILNWRYKETNVAEFQVYRAVQDGKYRLFRTVPSNIRRVEDEDMTINTNYRYMIRAIFRDGNVSATDELELKY